MTIDPDILDNAANYIERNGWYRGNFFPGFNHAEATGTVVTTMRDAAATTAPPMCAMGAIGVHCATSTEYFDIAEALGNVLGDFVPTWNDHTAKDKDEVVEFLRMEALKIRVASTPITTKEEVLTP